MLSDDYEARQRKPPITFSCVGGFLCVAGYKTDGEVSIFAGIVKCIDCGGNLVLNRKPLKSGGGTEFFRFGTYMQKGKDVCPPHRLDYNTLYQAVLSSVQEYAVLAVEDEKKLIDEILKANDEFKNNNVQR